MHTDSQRFKAIRERDVDLLLIEELTVNQAFREWFLNQIGESMYEVCECIGVWHSVSDSELGESDVVFGVLLKNGRRLLVLLENKIDAPFQDDQLERYVRRGEKGIDGEWDEFLTALVAPAAYGANSDQRDVVDSIVTYESVREWFKSRESPRSQFKAEMLTEAIEQNRRGYTPEPDEDVTSLHLYYWQLAHDRYPEIGMEEPNGVPKGNLWIRFKPAALPREVQLIHKMGRGDVDLQFSGAAERAEEFTQRYEPALSEGMEIVETHQSMIVRVHVPPITETSPPHEQQEEIKVGQQEAKRLMSWYERLGRNG